MKKIGFNTVWFIVEASFLFMFVGAIAHGLGIEGVGGWFLFFFGWFVFIAYHLEKKKAENKQNEINRYLKNKAN